eukprot:6337120-Amphidinium_carterae.3
MDSHPAYQSYQLAQEYQLRNRLVEDDNGLCCEDLSSMPSPRDLFGSISGIGSAPECGCKMHFQDVCLPSPGFERLAALLSGLPNVHLESRLAKI